MDEVLFELPQPGIALITLNRPAQRNAINAGMRKGLFEAFQRFEADPEPQRRCAGGAGRLSRQTKAELER